MKLTQSDGTQLNPVLRFAGWLIIALMLLAVGNAGLGYIKTGRYVLDMLLASFFWPLALLMVTRRWSPLFRILLVFFAVLAAYALMAVGFGLLGYQELVQTLYPWPTTSPIHLLPGALQALSVFIAAWTIRREKIRYGRNQIKAGSYRRPRNSN